MTASTTPRPFATPLRRLSKLAAHVVTATLAISASFAAPAEAGDNSDVSYEDIEHAFVDNFEDGYSWRVESIMRDGVSGEIKLAHDVRGEPNIWDTNGSFFENRTNRERYVRKAQEWATSDYLIANPDDADKVATSSCSTTPAPARTT